MSQHKPQSYYPSNFTLTLMDGFGTRKPFHKSSTKKLKPSQSLSKMPAFVRKQKVTYDKQSLLEQIRQQKQKSYFINITNNQLLKNISTKKLKIQRPTSSLLSRQRTGSGNSPLKREIQQLVAQIEQQNEELLKLKRSKKYNRYIELQTLKQTYLEEISQMKYKIRCFKHELKDKQRIRKQHKKRVKDIKAMNLAVEQRIDTENAVLSQKVQDLCVKIKDGMMKQISYRKEKERLLKEIYQLQAKTGKIYINEPHITQNLRNQSQTYPLSLFPKDSIQPTQSQQCLEQDQDCQSDSSSDFQSINEQNQTKEHHLSPKTRQKNLSF